MLLASIEMHICRILLLLLVLSSSLYAQEQPDWKALQAELEAATQAYSYGDIENSVPVFDRYMQVAKESGAHSRYLEALIYRAHAHAQVNAAEAGFDLLEQGRSYYQRFLPDNSLWQVKLDYMEGQIATMAGQYLRGLEALKNADKGIQQQDSMDFELAAAVSQNMGFLYDELGDRSTGVTYLQAAVDYFLQHENRDPGYLHVYYNFLANALAALGDLGRAELYLDEGMRIVRENDYIPNFYLASALIQKGDLYYDAGQYEKAAAFYQEGLDSIRANPQINASDSAHAHNGIGNAYKNLRLDEEALFHHRLAVQTAEQDEGQVFIQLPSFFHNLAEAYEFVGRDRERFQTLQKSEAFVETHLPERHRHRTTAYGALGKWHSDQEEWEPAMRYFQQALYAAGAEVDQEDMHAVPKQLPVEFGPSIILPLGQKIRGHLNRYQALGERKDLETAHALRKLGETALKAMQEGIQPGWGRRALSGRMVAFYEHAMEVTLQLYEATGEKKYLEEALQLAETASAQLLSLTLQDSHAKAYAGVDEAMLTEERTLKRKLAALQMQLNQTPTDALQEERFQVRQQLDSLIQAMETVYPAYHSLKYAPPRPALSQIQAKLKQEEAACLRFFWGETQVYVFIIQADSLSYHQVSQEKLLPYLAQLQEQLRDQQQAQERAGSAEVFQAFTQPAHQLFLQLIGPTEALTASAKSLLIVPDGPLSFLPFEVLLTEEIEDESTGYAALPYLFQDQQIRYLYSTQLILDANTEAPEHQYAGFAPKYEPTGLVAQYRSIYPNFGSLSGNAESVQQISQLMKGDAFVGEEATEQLFRQRANGYGILHLSMHALFNHSDPMYSGLVFSLMPDTPESSPAEQDGILHTYELYTLELKAQLAVLSACQTGDGAWQRGEGVASLARAFRYAGCPNVVMSLWEAEDESTRKLMELFFQNLQAGLPTAKALQQARITYLSETDRRHPHFWAPFVYMGDALPLQQPRSRWPFVLGGLLLGVVVMLIMRRKGKGKI